MESQPAVSDSRTHSTLPASGASNGQTEQPALAVYLEVPVSRHQKPVPGLLALFAAAGLLPLLAALLPFEPGIGKASGASVSAAADAEGAAAACWAACCEPCGKTLSSRNRTGHSAAEPLLRLAASRIACWRDRTASPGARIGLDNGSCRGSLGACFYRGYICIAKCGFVYLQKPKRRAKVFWHMHK